MEPLPEAIRDVGHLEALLSEPTDEVIEQLAVTSGDIIFLGVGGKMGPTLARMARRAVDASGGRARVIGVSRFSSDHVSAALEAIGVETIRCDLLDRAQVAKLPRVENVFYMPAMKFGATGQEALTWAMNAYLPGIVCEHFTDSRIVAFSTGNVYGLTPVRSGGSREDDTLHPEGDYAWSCLGRERIFEHFSRALELPVTLLRLNYAVEMRYGVLRDIAQRVWNGQPVDVTMGYLNAIWQGDANAATLLSLRRATSPPTILNITGPDLLSVRGIAVEFGRLLDREVEFTGEEAPDALLSNAQRAHELLGPPRIPIGQIIEWTADWVRRGGESLGKPTKFEVRTGEF